MMDIKLDTRTILEKEFKTGLRGYNTEEVDTFLDEIIKDYQAFNKKIERLENELSEMKRKLEEAKRKPATGNATNTNFDILQRISNLEKHVFGDKLSK